MALKQRKSPCLPESVLLLLLLLLLAGGTARFGLLHTTALAQAPAVDPISAAAASNVAPVAPAAPPPPAPAPSGSAALAGGTARIDAEPPGYAALVDAAIHEHELSHYSEARELLLKAHAIFPNARTMRGLGKVEYELRNYGQAVNYLENALASSIRPLDPRLRSEVEELLGRARAYVGEVHVAVEPSSASVIVDGVTVASGPQASFSLVVGDHLIEFHAAGHFPERRAVHIKGGEETSIQVVLNAPYAVTPGGPVRSPHDDSSHENRTKRRRWLAWTLSVAAVAGTAIALGFALRDDPTESADGGSSHVVLRNR